MAFKFPIRPYTRAQLDVMCNPASANQPEAIPHVLFDTQSYVSTTTTTLVYYQTVQADKSLGNMDSAGQLPEPQYFQVFNMGIDVLEPVYARAAAAVAGALDDVQQLVLSGRGYVDMTISGKKYCVGIPMSFFHQSGGVTGNLTGTFAATNGIEFANNSLPDGGWAVNGAIVIPPKQAFDITLRWPAAITLSATPRNIRFWMAGVLFRRVL